MSLPRDRQRYLNPGCTRIVAEFYGHIWGRDRISWLQIIRAFVIMFIWSGFLKGLVVTRNYLFASRGRWLSSALAVFLGVLQACFGEAAWFMFLAMIRHAMEDAPDFLDRGTFDNYEGWSFWAFFSAVHWTLLITSLYLFVEAAVCCTDDRRKRFGFSGLSSPVSTPIASGEYMSLHSPVKPHEYSAARAVTESARGKSKNGQHMHTAEKKGKSVAVHESAGAGSSSALTGPSTTVKRLSDDGAE